MESLAQLMDAVGQKYRHLRKQYKIAGL
ncbi:hypothetical protein Nmel_009925 [Mimus melanotis]